MTTLNVRIDEKTKLAANKVFQEVGLDMSSAIKVFLSQVVIEGGIPFKPTTNMEAIRIKWDKQVADAKATGKTYKNAHAALSGL